MERSNVTGFQVTIIVHHIHIGPASACSAANPVGVGDAWSHVEVNGSGRIICFYAFIIANDVSGIAARVPLVFFRVALCVVGFVSIHPSKNEGLIETGEAKTVLIRDHFHTGRFQLGKFLLVQSAVDVDVKVDAVLLINGSVGGILRPDSDWKKICIPVGVEPPLRNSVRKKNGQ